jgi:putative SOS response-associated peptidase YedK
MEPDSGTTNIRNRDSRHSKRWLGVESRCLVPFTSFSEFNKAEGGDIWLRPRDQASGILRGNLDELDVRPESGRRRNDQRPILFLTTEPYAEVGAIHPKVMPVILTVPEDLQTWMTAPAEVAMKLQRPLPEGALKIIARGTKEDEAPTL